LKIRGVQREKEKRKKRRFVSWKAYFSYYFFITPFLLPLKDDSKA
jgi:hypothetical protein